METHGDTGTDGETKEQRNERREQRGTDSISKHHCYYYNNLCYRSIARRLTNTLSIGILSRISFRAWAGQEQARQHQQHAQLPQPPFSAVMVPVGKKRSCACVWEVGGSGWLLCPVSVSVFLCFCVCCAVMCGAVCRVRCALCLCRFCLCACCCFALLTGADHILNFWFSQGFLPLSV